MKQTFALTTVLFGIAVTLFFALAYPHHLHFQEQYQLFLFNWSYVGEVLAEGGLADLVGRFLTQFFLYAWVGASIIAVLLVGIQLLAYRCLIYNFTIDNLRLNDKASSCQSSIKKLSIKSPVAYALSFVPSILCVCFLTDENALMTIPVALLMLLVLALLLRCSRIVAILATCGIVYILLSTKHYYRTDDVSLVWAWASVWVVPLLMLLCCFIDNFTIYNLQLNDSLPHKANSRKLSIKQLSIYIILWSALMLVGGVTVNSLQSQSKEDTMAYDFMARNAMWNRIIQMAQKRAPKNQVSVVALNLALSQRGLLSEHLFDYPQNGMAGLLPGKNKDSFSPLVTAEAFYRLGLINTAQRFVFEAQEAIPDFQKSARCYKRLAETNLINGSYEVARKYLNALRQTLYYRSWAEETLALLSDKAVEAHTVYGELRRMRCHEDYFFGGNTPHQILVRQLEANPENRMAEEYLKAACMLQPIK